MAKIPFLPISTGRRKKTFIITITLGRHTRSQNVEILLGAITKSRKEAISFVMSAHLHKTTDFTDFHESDILTNVRKSVQKIQVCLKSDNNKGYFI
jgi:hypothetical protein